MAKYAELIAQPCPIATMSDLFDRYAAEVIPTKAPSTQTSNQRELGLLRAVFGRMRPEDLSTQDIYRYLDERGRKAPVRANREIALLSHVLRKAVRWGVLAKSPALHIERHRERPRERDVTLEELQAVYALASPTIQVAMDLAVLTGLRQGDILQLRLQDLSDEGLTVRTSKTGTRLLFELTPGLRETVERARCLRRRIGTMYLLANRHGKAYTGSGFRAIWQRVMRGALDSGALADRFTFHDLRALAAKLAEDPQALLGHTSKRQTNAYLRAPKKVKPTR
jgi:integrase